jgi:predicted TIM-barrel fold metal-dependent hydrolase
MIIDTDSHLTEPADLWTERLPSTWGDRRLHVKWDAEEGADVWLLGDHVVQKAWQGCGYRWEGIYPDMPPRLADCHPANYEIDERTRVMDGSGIDVAVLYPNIGGADLNRFGWSAEVAAAHAAAYNDFQLEWIADAPGRFIPMAVVPYWDLDRAVAEIERVAGCGFGGIIMTGAPQAHGQPFFADRHWDRLWSAAVSAELSINFHVGGGDLSAYLNPQRLATEGARTSYARLGPASFLENAQQLNDLLLSGVLARFPDLRVASVESGVGWVPFVLAAADHHFKKAKVWIDRPEFGDLLPSDLFRRQVYANYWFERVREDHIEAIGEDHLLFESDFPHPTCIVGEEVRDAVTAGLAGLSAQVREKIMWRNAAALYRFRVDEATSSR